VPPEIWDGIDADSVIRQVEHNKKQAHDAGFEAGGGALLQRADRQRLSEGSAAARLLLATLDRGLEATTPELDDAVEARLRDQGLQ
jgi:hypothetical protein